MRKLIILIILAVGVISAYAAEYDWLTFTLDDNTEVSVATDGLQLVYSDGKLRVFSSTVDETFALSSLSSMRFTAQPTGISQIETDDAHSPLLLYSIQGQFLGSFSSMNQIRAGVSSGVYIIQQGSATHKVIF